MVEVIGESSGSDNPYVLRTVSADTVVNGGLVGGRGLEDRLLERFELE